MNFVWGKRVRNVDVSGGAMGNVDVDVDGGMGVERKSGPNSRALEPRP